MNLSTILKEIETNRPNAEMDVTLGSPDTYGGRVGLKRAATETIKRLKLDYRNHLMESTLFIVVTGSSSEDFTQLASNDSFGCFSSDPEEFYKDIASRINPSLYGRESVKGLFNIATNILYDKAMELDVGSYNDIQFSEKYNSAVNTQEDFAALMKLAINDQMGPEIVGINAIHSVVDKAIKSAHAASVTPVVLSTTDENFALSLYKNLPELVPHGALTAQQLSTKKKNKAFLVVAGKASKALSKADGVIVVKTVNEESVAEALTLIKNKVL